MHFSDRAGDRKGSVYVLYVYRHSSRRVFCYYFEEQPIEVRVGLYLYRVYS